MKYIFKLLTTVCQKYAYRSNSVAAKKKRERNRKSQSGRQTDT